jgi:hypothetical protein
MECFDAIRVGEIIVGEYPKPWLLRKIDGTMPMLNQGCSPEVLFEAMVRKIEAGEEWGDYVSKTLRATVVRNIDVKILGGLLRERLKGPAEELGSVRRNDDGE